MQVGLLRRSGVTQQLSRVVVSPPRLFALQIGRQLETLRISSHHPSMLEFKNS